MDRRTLIATAGAITLTVLAGTTAIAANVGILGNGVRSPVGRLSPVVEVRATTPDTNAADSQVTTAPEQVQVETIYVDKTPQSYGSSQSQPSAGATGGSGSTVQADPATSGGAVAGDDAAATVVEPSESEPRGDEGGTTATTESRTGGDTQDPGYERFEGGEQDD